MNQQPIGIFDSGLGGLTVAKEIMRLLPQESIVYFGDTARVPYGEKSAETIQRYSIENGIFLIEQNVKLLVVACNTATAYALDKLKTLFKVPVIGVIDPACEEVIKVTKNQKIAILGTKGTIRSGVYEKKILAALPDAQVLSLACPLFVPFVEEGWLEHPAFSLIAKEYLQKVLTSDVDTLLLGCTHYPLLKKIIEPLLDEKITIIDSATVCAEKLRSILAPHSNPNPVQPHRFFVSDDPERFRTLGEQFLGSSIPHVDLRK